MPIGLNRQNDTPIGGLPEFRGNLQGGDVFSVGEIPVFDGAKFAPGINAALVLGFGGLVKTLEVGIVANGDIIADWDAVMPLGGSALQMTPNPTLGIITVDQQAIYQIDWQANLASLTNNQDYFFELVVGGIPTTFGTHIVGSNNVSSQSSGFSLMAAGDVAGTLAVTADNAGSNTFDVVSMSLTCTRIG